MKKLIYLIGVIFIMSIIVIACQKQDSIIEQEEIDMQEESDLKKKKKKKNKKIKICHIDEYGNWKTISINKKAWPAHQAHGDMLFLKFPKKGDYALTFYENNGTIYNYDLFITQSGGGSFSGIGGVPAGGGTYNDTWTVSGTFSQGYAEFTIDYDDSDLFIECEGGFECGEGINGEAESSANQVGTWIAVPIAD